MTERFTTVTNSSHHTPSQPSRAVKTNKWRTVTEVGLRDMSMDLGRRQKFVIYQHAYLVGLTFNQGALFLQTIVYTTPETERSVVASE